MAHHRGCGHMAHHSCLVEAYNYNVRDANCPICRGAVPTLKDIVPGPAPPNPVVKVKPLAKSYLAKVKEKIEELEMWGKESDAALFGALPVGSWGDKTSKVFNFDHTEGVSQSCSWCIVTLVVVVITPNFQGSRVSRNVRE